MAWNSFKMKRTKADALFSLYIRWRDNWTCLVCKWPADETDPEQRYNIDSAHFFGRGNQSTRFDPDNACAACKKCHTNHLHGPGHKFHEDLMQRVLGDARYASLWLRGHATGKAQDEMMMRLLWSEELRKIGVDPKTGRRFHRAFT